MRSLIPWSVSLGRLAMGLIAGLCVQLGAPSAGAQCHGPALPGLIVPFGEFDPVSVALGDLDGDGDLDKAVTNDAFSLYHSSGVTVSLNACEVTGCRADMNHDGRVDVFDVTIYLAAYATHDPRADWIHDGVLDFFRSPDIPERIRSRMSLSISTAEGGPLWPNHRHFSVCA